MPGVVLPFKRLFKQMRTVITVDESARRTRARSSPAPPTYSFPKRHHQLFDAILNELKLKNNRAGQPRMAYRLRHTCICLRLMEGASIKSRKNCQTSVEMIEKYYASHLVNTLDTTAINLRKPKRSRAPEPEDKPTSKSG
jgi:hypothetical protein